jgi:hypothetical protein
MRSLKYGLLLVLAAFSLSCGDMPVAPRERVEVTGTVTDRQGQALEGATVEFYPRFRTAEYEVFTATTRGNGEYQVELPSGLYAVLVGGESGSVRMIAGLFTVSPTNRHLNFRYQGVSISGSLLGPSGTTLPRASVFVSGPSGYGSAAVEDSGYSIMVPPGCYRINYWPGTDSLGLPTLTLPWVCVGSDTTIDIVLDGYPVGGTVFGPNGQPMSRVSVTGIRSDFQASVFTRTQSDGTYELRAPAGIYHFWATSPDSLYIAPHSQGPLSVVGPQTLDWDLSNAEWTGFVRWADDHSPVPLARVSVEELGVYRGAIAVADSSGLFRLFVQPGVTYAVYASGKYGYASIGGIVAGSDSTFDILIPRIYP